MSKEETGENGEVLGSGITGGLVLYAVGSYAGSSLGKWIVDITKIEK